MSAETPADTQHQHVLRFKWTPRGGHFICECGLTYRDIRGPLERTKA